MDRLLSPCLLAANSFLLKGLPGRFGTPAAAVGERVPSLFAAPLKFALPALIVLLGATLSVATPLAVSAAEKGHVVGPEDVLPSLSINTVGHVEGNTGTTPFVFTVTLSNTTAAQVTVDYATSDGQATVANNDYQPTSGTLTIPPNTPSGAITVIVNGDLTQESDEAFGVQLSNPVNATLGAQSVGIGIINNDDGVPSLSISDASVAEGNPATTTALVFTVTLSNLTDQSVTVDYATADGSATVANNDYQAASGTLTIAPKAANATLTVLVNGDDKKESNETFFINLSNPVNAMIGTAQGKGTILDDDVAPSITIADASKLEGDSGTSALSFTLTLSNPSELPVSVFYATTDGSATTANNDYVAVVSGTVTFPAKATTATADVMINGDTTTEGNETLFVNLGNPVNATIADGQAMGTILNDDAPPTLSVGDVAQAEGNSGTSNFVFTVALSHLSDRSVTVNFATADGSATLSNNDYLAASGTLTIPAKAAARTVTVSVRGDLVDESDEQFFVNLSNPTNATLGDAQGTGTILNDDTPVSIADASKLEGDSGTSTLSFTLTLAHTSQLPVSVFYATADGSATLANNDYVGVVSGSVAIAPQSTTATADVQIRGDTTTEGNETFFVNLIGAVNATIADGQAVGTILSDDLLPPNLWINNVTMAEGTGGTTAFQFTVRMARLTDQPVTVNFATANGSATVANNDYQPTSGTLTIPAKTMFRTITVLVNGDNVYESDESFFVNLSSAVNAVIIGPQGVGMILNDDAPPFFSINDVSMPEGNSGTTAFVFTVGLSPPTDRQVTVNFATADGSATSADNDYQPTNGTLTIPPKASTATITVLVNGDTRIEGDQTFFVNLSNAVNAGIDDPQGMGTIVNDDGALPRLSISDVTHPEGNSGTTPFVFTVSLSQLIDEPVTVDYTTSDGSATLANNDYAQTQGSLTIPANTPAGSVTVLVNGDRTLESSEAFTVQLSNPVNATIADGLGIGLIGNDDNFPTVSIMDVTASEGDAGTKAFNFTVFLSNPTDQPVTVNYTTADGSATTADGDYQSTNGTLTILPKSGSGIITVLVNGDTRIEPAETFTVTLFDPVNAAIADGQGIGTIDNDDTPTAASATGITEFALTEPRPNPSPGSVRMEILVPREAPVRVSVLDLQGREVAILIDGVYRPGRYPVTWNPMPARGERPAGLYFVSFRAPGRQFLRRLVLTR